MSIDIGSFSKDISNKIYSITGLNFIFSNICVTSILLSSVILLIIMILFPFRKGTGAFLLGKLLLYIYISVLLTLIIYRSTIKNIYEKKYTDKNVKQFIDTIGGNVVYEKDSMRVKPNYYKDVESTNSSAKNRVNPTTAKGLLDEMEYNI